MNFMPHGRQVMDTDIAAVMRGIMPSRQLNPEFIA
jgi:hypothetical protein